MCVLCKQPLLDICQLSGSAGVDKFDIDVPMHLYTYVCTYVTAIYLATYLSTSLVLSHLILPYLIFLFIWPSAYLSYTST